MPLAQVPQLIREKPFLQQERIPLFAQESKKWMKLPCPILIHLQKPPEQWEFWHQSDLISLNRRPSIQFMEIREWTFENICQFLCPRLDSQRKANPVFLQWAESMQS
uniref:hypothetical protein n=1 Tax=Jatropha curcas TaxID=180498 RepID=UPI0027A9ABB2|nr:hypothetical protein QLP06_mgp053 [Jatropha curcas]WFG81186.1 hypothetical protein [Jatropha curcas]